MLARNAAQQEQDLERFPYLATYFMHLNQGSTAIGPDRTLSYKIAGGGPLLYWAIAAQGFGISRNECCAVKHEWRHACRARAQLCCLSTWYV